jgi:hypothetical protein
LLSRLGKSNPLRPQSNAVRDANWRPTTNDVPRANYYPAALMINGKRIAGVMPAWLSGVKTVYPEFDLKDLLTNRALAIYDKS